MKPEQRDSEERVKKPVRLTREFAKQTDHKIHNLLSRTRDPSEAALLAEDWNWDIEE